MSDFWVAVADEIITALDELEERAVVWRCSNELRYYNVRLENTDLLNCVRVPDLHPKCGWHVLIPISDQLMREMLDLS